MTSGPITVAGLEHLKNHQYQSSEYTPLDNIMNAHLWTKIVPYIPMWVAPNLITLVGSLILGSSVFLIMLYDLTLSKELPTWVYIYAGITIFLYQICDAIDGKQARRTGSSSPLGQLFDHGCDAFACTCIVLLSCQVMRLGNSYLSILLLYILAITFFLTNWEEQHVGVLRTGVGNIGVTEGQLTICFTLIITGILGGQIWSWGLKMLVMTSSAIGQMMFVVAIMKKVLKGNKQKLRALSLLIPICLVVIFSLAWVHTHFYKEYPALVLLTVGLQFYTLTIKMIIATVTRMKFDILQYEPFALALPLLNVFFGFSEMSVFLCVFAITFGSAASYVVRIINQLTEYLGIKCFSITSKKD